MLGRRSQTTSRRLPTATRRRVTAIKRPLTRTRSRLTWTAPKSAISPRTHGRGLRAPKRRGTVTKPPICAIERTRSETSSRSDATNFRCCATRLLATNDQEAADLDAGDDLTDRHAVRLEEVRKTSRASRIRARGDRARAARDREQATRDRELAARDREQAASDREYASTDELTGARRRGVGLEDLDNEMNRAWRQGDSLRVAYVDVDGLKSVTTRRATRQETLSFSAWRMGSGARCALRPARATGRR